MADAVHPPVHFRTHPDRYLHWDLSFDGPVATLTMKVAEDRPMWPGAYELKLNSYDLAVDIELADAVERIRFQHPEVRAVVLTSALDKVFCAGANIRFLGQASHAFKVNFCRYTNETRAGIEDASRHSGIHWIAALNGTASGGGYELALTADEILLIDDGNAAVSLPEVPLLGVLPGTGGLTRITDKRRVRRDVADVFCTKAEGFRARDALRFGFVDAVIPRSRWADAVAERARAAAEARAPRAGGPGVPLPELAFDERDDGWSGRFVDLRIEGRAAHLRIRGPDADPERSAATWALHAFRELDETLVRLRFNHLEVGLVLVRTEGDPAAVLAHEAAMLDGAAADWFWEEVRLFQARVLRRLDNGAKTVYALVEPGNAFAGPLLDIALAADRTYMYLDPDERNAIRLGRGQGGAWPMGNGRSRLAQRFPADPEAPARLLARAGEAIGAEEAEELGLVTMSPDEFDWEDEVRIAVEERLSLSPDALTGMEQNLRFGGPETCETKIFGRLSAWQNWIFQRPNAVGERGALKLFGHPERPVFDFRRT